MNLKKRKKNATMLLIVMTVFIFSSIGIITKAAGGTAAKIGTYCSVTGICVDEGNNKLYCNAIGENRTNVTRFMTASLKIYKDTGVFYDSAYYEKNVLSGNTIKVTMSNVPNNYKVYAQTSIYGGTSISSAQLETISVNPN